MAAQVESITLSNDYPKEESPWKLVFRRFRKHKLAMQ